MRTIYVDVLLSLNLFINYFLLLAVSKFLSWEGKRGRLLLASLAGAFYSLTILLPELPDLLSLLLKLLVSGVIIRIAWPFRGWLPFFKAVAVFYLINFAFAGFMLAIWYFIAPEGLTIRNSVVYFSVSPVLFLFLTVLSYLTIRLLQRITGKNRLQQTQCQVTIFYKGQKITCDACVDTGNRLEEPFSGYPVIVIEKEKCPTLPQEEPCRFIPFRAVHTEGLLKAFRPERVVIRYGNKETQCKNVYIAMSETPLSAGNFSALINPDLIL